MCLTVKKANFGEVYRRMFTGDRHCVKRLDSLILYIELRIKWRIPIDAVAPPQYVIINYWTRS